MSQKLCHLFKMSAMRSPSREPVRHERFALRPDVRQTHGKGGHTRRTGASSPARDLACRPWPCVRPLEGDLRKAPRSIACRLKPCPIVPGKIGRAHVCTPVTNAHLVCRLLIEKKKKIQINTEEI